MARKRSGEIVITKITEAPNGQTAEIVHTRLSDKKEELEEYFARRFVEKFNSQILGPAPLIGYMRVSKADGAQRGFGGRRMLVIYAESWVLFAPLSSRVSFCPRFRWTRRA